MARQAAAATRRERRAAQRAARTRDRRPPRESAPRPSLRGLSIIGLVGGVLVVVAAIAFGGQPGATSDAADVAIARAPAGLATDGVVIGAPDAPVTVDLYEDFQCPACGLWSRTVFPMLAANELAAGTVRVVFHDIAFLGPESADAGKAGFAATQQGRFWDMWATLYANQGRENSGAFSRDRLLTMAGRLGLDLARFEADMDSPAAGAALAAAKAEGAAAGVTSTPTLIVAGQVLLGVRPYAELAAAIAAAAAVMP